MRKPVVLVLAAVVGVGGTLGAVRGVEHVRAVRRAAADERDAARTWAAKEPQRQAVRRLGTPTGVTPCPQFPRAMRDWGEVCWQASGSPVEAAVLVRGVLRRHGVTDLSAACSQREPGWVLCHVQGLLQGYRLGLTIARADHETVNGLQLHGTQVRGGINMFWRDVPASASPGWTPVTIPPG